MKKKKIVISLIAATALVAMSGCGGGGGIKAAKETKSSLSVSGGDGYWNGGAGGTVRIEVDNADVRIEKEGEADASFDLPEHREDLGEYPAVFSASTIVAYGHPGNRSLGSTAANVSQIFYYNGSSLMEDREPVGDPEGDVIVTGLKVQEGAELLIEAAGDDSVELDFENDIVVNGTLRAIPWVEESNASKGIELESATWIAVGKNGRIEATGRSSQSGDAESGHPITLRVDNTDVTTGMVIEGTLVASGGDGAQAGGSGGDVELYLYDDGAIYLSGTIESRGGEGSSTWGGSGGDVELSSYGALYISGDIMAEGGESLGDGGRGGYVRIGTVESDGTPENLLMSGTVSVKGGASTGTPENTPEEMKRIGGEGGTIKIYMNGENSEKRAISGTLRAEGGDSLSGPAGSAGGIELHSSGEIETELAVSAKFEMEGGDSEQHSGGSGGQLEIEYSCFGDTKGLLHLMGYESVAFEGGDGHSIAGKGGEFHYNLWGGLEGFSYTWVNQSTLYGYGGDASEVSEELEEGGEGGDGGELEIHAQQPVSLVNSGDIYLYGGKSWGDVDNSNGGDITVCVPEGSDANLSEGVNVDLSAGTGGEGEAGEDGSVITDCV
jgi:hypothetical protein